MTKSATSCRVWAAVTVWPLAAALLAAAPGVCVAEDGQPSNAAGPASPAGSAPGAAPSLAPPAPQPRNPAAGKQGFLEAFGLWWQQSVDDFNARMKDAQKTLGDFNEKQRAAAKDAAAATQEAMKDAAQATKDAAAAIVRLPNTRVIETRARCTVASNGAPDCQAAATSVCRSKGFDTGQPLDVSSADGCATTMWLSGEKHRDGSCPVEAIVTRAICQ